MRPASDMEDYKQAWNERIEVIERLVLAEIDKLAATGFSDRRLCAISRTNFETAIMALQKALRIGSSEPGASQDYGKQTMPDPMPSQFAPPVDPEPYRNRGAQGQQTQANTEAVPRVDWKDYGAGQKSGEN